MLFLGVFSQIKNFFLLKNSFYSKRFILVWRGWILHPLCQIQISQRITLIFWSNYFAWTSSNKPVNQISWFTLCLVPSSPRNVRVIVEENVLIVSWLPPEYPYGEIKHYIVSWRRSNRNETYMKENVISSPFVIKHLGKYFNT